MTTSYKKEAIKALKAQKKLEREAEAEALLDDAVHFGPTVCGAV